MKILKKISLSVGITIVTISIVVIIVNFLKASIPAYERALGMNIPYNDDFWFWHIIELIFTKAPLVFSEISLFKNFYVFLGKEQSKFRKILCVISFILAVLVFIISCIIYENKNYEYHVRSNLMLVSWPILIVSFIFGSRRIAKKRTN